MTYLRNAWYCAGWTADLGRTPVTKTFLEEPVLMYRREDGTPVAVSNRCPHRFAPLHKGKLKGDRIECPYHGLQFDHDGACVLNPHGEGAIPRAAKLKAYPLVEHQGALWIWMGEPDQADASAIVATPFLTQPERYASVSGYLKVDVNYQLFIDNLLDLTHAPYLHPETLGGPPENSIGKDKMTVEFHQGERDVESNYLVRGMPATPQLAPFWGERPPGDFRALMHWHAPSSLVLEVSLTKTGAPKDDGIVLPVMHFLTPETETTTHYFFATGHNRDIHDTAKTAQLVGHAKRAFEYEDEPMVKDCQDLMGTTDLFSLNPVLLQTDIAAVRARRLLDALIAAERSAGAKAA